MQRRSPYILALAVILGASSLSYREFKANQRSAARLAAKKDEAQKSPPDAPSSSIEDKNAVGPAASRAEDTSLSRSRFNKLADGSDVPPLPASAPERVKLGVVLFRYLGAEGASESSRSREEALNLAKNAIKEGKNEFALAVKQGDRGSDENFGWMPQGVLERSVEHVVFNLEKGAMTEEPLDTPRGFWVVKRVR